MCINAEILVDIISETELRNCKEVIVITTHFPVPDHLIDDIYGTFGFSQTIDLRRSYGMNVENMKNYSFYLFKWSNRPVTLFQFDATDTVNFETGAF